MTMKACNAILCSNWEKETQKDWVRRGERDRINSMMMTTHGSDVWGKSRRSWGVWWKYAFIEEQQLNHKLHRNQDKQYTDSPTITLPSSDRNLCLVAFCPSLWDHKINFQQAYTFKISMQCTTFTFTFTFMHLADAFIQSDLHCIQVTVSTFYQLLLSLGIEPMILALLTPCSTSWATGKLFLNPIRKAFIFNKNRGNNQTVVREGFIVPISWHPFNH